MTELESKYELSEAAVRLVLKEGVSLYSMKPLSNPEVAAEVMSDMMCELDREYVFVVNLDNMLRPINYSMISAGDINETVVPVQNIFKSAILSNAKYIMMLHNHPSGDITPSAQDQNVTKRVYSAGKLMGISLIDHIIVGGVTGRRYSFAEENSQIFE